MGNSRIPLYLDDRKILSYAQPSLRFQVTTYISWAERLPILGNKIWPPETFHPKLEPDLLMA